MSEDLYSAISDGPQKRCTKCLERKSIECFFKQPHGKYGVTSRCMPCVAAYRRERRYMATPQEIKDARSRKQCLTVSGLRECTRCLDVKPFDDFYIGKRGMPVGFCKPCELAEHAEWKAENNEHMFSYVRGYHSRPEVREKKNLARKVARMKSPKLTMQTTLAHGIRRRTTVNPATIDDLMAMWEKQKGRCAISGIPLTWGQGKVKPNSISLDRINPDEGYSASNLRLICHAINAFRGVMSDAEMLVMAKAIVANAEPTIQILGLFSEVA
jgi:hypothetical protein